MANNPRTVLITGGTTGIGRATANRFANAGDLVVATSLPQQPFDPFPSENVRVLSLDVRDSQSIQTLASHIDQLDILVNCAGIILRDAQEFSSDGFQKVIDASVFVMGCEQNFLGESWAAEKAVGFALSWFSLVRVVP